MAKQAARKTVARSARKDNVVRLDQKILLANVTKAAFGYARGETGLIESIRTAAGNNDPAKQEEIKRAFWRGHMAYAMFPDADTMTAAHLAEADRVLAQKTKDRESGHAAMYDNARQVWSRLLKRINVKTADPRGGDTSTSKGPRPGGNQKKGQPEEGARIVDAPPTADLTAEQVAHQIKFAATRLLQLVNTNKDKLPGEWVRGVEDFANFAKEIPDAAAQAPAEEEKAPAPRPRKAR